MQTIGLLAAIPQERDALLRCMHGWKQISLGSFRAYCLELRGLTCYLVTSGMGARRAGEAAQALIAMSAPHMLLSFGVAGAVGGADLQIGDVVLAEAVGELVSGLPGPLQPLAALPAAAREAAAQALSSRGARVWAGTALTTGGVQPREDQLKHLLHPILEMETAGIARAAARSSIPLVSIRAISDGPGAPVPLDIGAVMGEDASLKTGRLLWMVLRQPRILFQFPRFLKNSRLAADNAAFALAAVLRQISG